MVVEGPVVRGPTGPLCHFGAPMGLQNPIAPLSKIAPTPMHVPCFNFNIPVKLPCSLEPVKTVFTGNFLKFLYGFRQKSIFF